MTTPDESEFQEPQTPEEAQAAFEHLFDEVIDLLQMTVDNIEQNPDSVPEGLEAKISKLEEDVALFEKLGKSLGHDPERIDEEGNPKLTKREKASIERGEKAIKGAEEAMNKLPQYPPTGPADISDDKERRKHFKRLGRKRI